MRAREVESTNQNSVRRSRVGGRKRRNSTGDNKVGAKLGNACEDGNSGFFDEVEESFVRYTKTTNKCRAIFFYLLAKTSGKSNLGIL